MNYAVFGKNTENAKKYADIKLVTNDERSYLGPQPNIMQLTKQFSGKLLASDTTKTKVVMNKPDYLGFFIQSFSKIEMDGF